ncbi:1572_t:CDS:2, partial [Racocetra persica]
SSDSDDGIVGCPRDKIGTQKFTAIVSDTEAAIMAAKYHITARFPNILAIRCIVHHIQLIATGVALQDDIIETFVVGENLKPMTKTKWSIAWDVYDSMLHLENSIKL